MEFFITAGLGKRQLKLDPVYTEELRPIIFPRVYLPRSAASVVSSVNMLDRKLFHSQILHSRVKAEPFLTLPQVHLCEFFSKLCTIRVITATGMENIEKLQRAIDNAASPSFIVDCHYSGAAQLSKERPSRSRVANLLVHNPQRSL